MRNFRKLFLDKEKDLAKSLLRWKMQKEGKPAPDEETISRVSGTVVEEANEIIKRRGKNILEEFKSAAREFKKGMKSE
ncbi:MAG: hypothetical protein HY788_13535 [Deltaproteobacteria bacterium]|nr:hypothetical protein [Deltaproteobacteria bacterium]